MSQAKFTPGPWEIDYGFGEVQTESTIEIQKMRSYGGIEKCICTLHVDNYEFSSGRNVEEQEANAKLIIAAPELLQGCEIAAHFIKGLNESLEAKNEFSLEVASLVNSLFAVVAKAKSETL